MQRLVRVDGKVRTDATYPAGFMDVIDIEKTDEHFRLIYDSKGRFVTHRITKVRRPTFPNATVACALLLHGSAAIWCSLLLIMASLAPVLPFPAHHHTGMVKMMQLGSLGAEEVLGPWCRKRQGTSC